MTEPLLTISAFARAAGLTASALRHYDEVGLLAPADVDAATGYRYYTPDLVRRAGLIARMREIALPIEAMRTVLDGSLDDAAAVLREHAAEQARRSARAESAVTDLLTALAAGRAAAAPSAITVAGPELAAAIRQARAAADTDRSSPLGSVLLDLQGGDLDVVATNRYWMVARTLAVPAEGGDTRVVLALSDAADLADRLDAEDRVEVRLAPDQVVAAGGRWPGRSVAYPDHRALLAGLEAPTVRAVLAAPDLARATEASGRAEVDMLLGDDVVQVTAGGSSAVRVDARVVGPPATVRLGSALLRRALASVVGTDVVITVSSARRPVVLRSPHQRGFVAAVMPIATS